MEPEPLNLIPFIVLGSYAGMIFVHMLFWNMLKGILREVTGSNSAYIDRYCVTKWGESGYNPSHFVVISCFFPPLLWGWIITKIFYFIGKIIGAWCRILMSCLPKH